MSDISLNIKNTGVTQKSIMEYKAQVENIHKDLHRRASNEKDFVGWLDLPTDYDKDEFKRIKIQLKDIEKQMRNRLNAHLKINAKTENTGVIEIRYDTQEELDRIYLLINSIR